jgi:hypothetical protein
MIQKKRNLETGVDIDKEGYAVCVPFVGEENGGFFLKTLFPSRKYTNRFHLEGSHGQAFPMLPNSKKGSVKLQSKPF